MGTAVCFGYLSGRRPLCTRASTEVTHTPRRNDPSTDPYNIPRGSGRRWGAGGASSPARAQTGSPHTHRKPLSAPNSVYQRRTANPKITSFGNSQNTGEPFAYITPPKRHLGK